MKFEIHVYHHLGAEDSALLSQIIKLLLPVGAKLDGISEKLNVMKNQEQELNTGISELRDVTVEGFKSVNDAVEKATQRVITRLEQKDVDLADEIEILKEMKSAVRGSTNDAVTQLDKIAPNATSETPPIVDPVEQTETTEESAPAENGSGETSGNQTEENNQPFDSNPVENASDGFDDQERTPVPSL